MAAALLALSCGPSHSSPPRAGSPEPASTASSNGPDSLRRKAEAQYLSYATPALAGLVRGQPWFDSMTAPQLGLVSALIDCEKAAVARGEGSSVWELLQYASEQEWYRDGLDDEEARGLEAVVRAYARSLVNDNAPAIGPALGATIRYQLFRVLSLEQSGDVALIVAGENSDLGRKALAIATERLPQVEALVGKFPYRFLFFEVTEDIPWIYAGLSYDEFIALAPEYVDAETIIHESTHSTLYGAFPTWFEEGLAHFVEYFLTGQLDIQARFFKEDLRAMRAGEKLDLRSRRVYTDDDEFEERAQGFLLLNALYELEGIDTLSKTIKALRTRTYNDSELLAAIIDHAPEGLRASVRRLFCERITGSTKDYCASG